MKKILLLVALVATTTLGAFAQSEKGEKSVVIEGGAKSNPGRFMLGAQGRYAFIDQFRVAPSAYFVFPKDHTVGFDANVDLHYVYGLDVLTPGLNVYPLTGLSMQNGHYSYKGSSDSFTNWGFNLGAGFDYAINNSSLLNIEFKYTFGNADCFNVFFGYGIKF